MEGRYMERECLTRSFSNSELSNIVNHHSIFSHIMDDRISYPMDCTGLLDDKDNFFFTFNHGGILFLKTGEETYSMDMYSIPPTSGCDARKAAKLALDFIFRHGARVITAEISRENKPSQHHAYYLGFRRTNAEDEIRTVQGKAVGFIRYRLENDKHRQRDNRQRVNQGG